MEKKKKLNTREVVMLLVLLLLGVGLLYYFFIFSPATDQITSLQNKQDDVQAELDALQVRADMLASMRAELETLREENIPVAAYNNQKPVVALLDGIMANSQEFEINFTEETAEDQFQIVRRVANITYKCNTYAQIRDIINRLCELPFRSQVGEASISAQDSTGIKTYTGNIAVEPIKGTIVVTFYESLE